MKRHSKGSAFDISIHRDELEQTRRQLEDKLKSNISISLPSASDEEDYMYHQHSSVEYPRHDSGPIPYPDFPSFAHRSRDYLEEDTPMHSWSYRTGDDEEGINPYGGETMSTAAHHASALTITAGLAGGRGTRRDVSLSGAEYDPDRPLNQMMAGVGRMSMFDDPSKSKNNVNSTTFEPLVVDSTAELDRILQSGYAPPPSFSRSIHPTPPMSNASSSSSDSEAGSPSRSKLSDRLRHVPFSPKRPRTGQLFHSSSSVHQQPVSPLANKSQNNSSSAIHISVNMTTPRPTKRMVSNPAQTPSGAQPEVRLQPPTPSTASSKFTRMARGITKEIEDTQVQETARPAASGRPPPSQRKASHETPKKDSAQGRSNMSRRGFSREISKSKIVLPDVTGLTTAVESPAKPGKEYHPYKSPNVARESEARLLQTLSVVQSKLKHLDEENGISRRRVRELEMELDECKREVARERTRLLEREDVIVQQQKDLVQAAGRAKGKGKAKDASQDLDEVTTRYKEAVEEKKALESLINTLRTHLTRLTSELASHHELLVELRDLRDSDSRTLREKGAEIVHLKDEVERLAGEIEVLRGVVEEGLRERRASKDVSVQQSQADIAMSQDLDQEEDDEVQQPNEQETDEEREASRPDESDEEELDGFDSSIQLSRGNQGQADKTMRTDHATLGSSHLGNSTATPHRVQFIDQQELQRIAAEVEERRSDKSMNESVNLVSGTQRSRSPSPLPTRRQQNHIEREWRDSDRPRTPIPPSSPEPSEQPRPTTATSSLPTPPKQSEVRPPRQPKRHSDGHLETPFPQIRGERLERLFFSAPEHNPKTCTVCYRRRHRKNTQHSPSWVPPRTSKSRRPAPDSDEDEGFGEGSEDAEGQDRGLQQQRTQHEELRPSTNPNVYRKAANKTGLPPQTVVMRVIRELEDDFTHYKSIYVELADQYKDMDPVSDVPKRNLLAQHLREVVDILEQKGDQIASLYDLLTFKDKPVCESAVPPKQASGNRSWT